MNWGNIAIAAVILLAVAAILGALLALGGKYLAVKEDTRVTDVTGMLPGFNCGGCGCAGCAGFADQLVNEGADINRCRVTKPEAKEKIKAYIAEHK